MLCCDRCKTTAATTYNTSADGKTTLCQACVDIAENEKRAAEKAKRDEAMRPIRDRERELLLECRASEARRDEIERRRKPEVLRADLDQLTERLALLEQAVAELKAAKKGK